MSLIPGEYLLKITGAVISELDIRLAVGKPTSVSFKLPVNYFLSNLNDYQLDKIYEAIKEIKLERLKIGIKE